MTLALALIASLSLTHSCATPSVEEIERRIAALQAEIAREKKFAAARPQQASAGLAVATVMVDEAMPLATAAKGAAADARSALDLATATELLDRADAELAAAKAGVPTESSSTALTEEELGARIKKLEDRIDLEIKLATDKKEDQRKADLDVIKVIVGDAKRQHEDAVKATDPTVRAKLLASAQLMFERASAEFANIDTVFLHSPWFRVHAGAATVSPYTLKPSAADGGRLKLQNADTSTTFYTEFAYIHRVALLDPAQRLGPGTGHEWLKPEDYEFRFRFINREGQVQTSTESANGDWGFEASIGYSLWEYNLELQRQNSKAMTKPRGSINFELNAGFDTDREGLQVRGYYQAGIGSVWSIPTELQTGVFRDATVFTGLHYGIHEFPRIDTDNVVYSTDARPHFNRLGSVGVKVDFTVPIARHLEGVLQGRLFTPVSRPDLPDDWSLLLGVSVPIGRWFRALTSD